MLINVCHNRDIVIRTLLILFFVAHSCKSTSPKSGGSQNQKGIGVAPGPFLLSHTQKKKGSGYARLKCARVTGHLKQFLKYIYFRTHNLAGFVKDSGIASVCVCKIRMASLII